MDKLTEGEIAILKGILFNEYNDPHIKDGKLNSDPVWSWSIYEVTNASKVCKTRQSMSGFISSLIKKGLIAVDPEKVQPSIERCTWLTEKGIELVTPYFSEWEKEEA